MQLLALNRMPVMRKSGTTYFIDIKGIFLIVWKRVMIDMAHGDTLFKFSVEILHNDEQLQTFLPICLKFIINR